MKVSVASKKQKVLQAIMAVIILVPSAFYYAYNLTKLFKPNIIICTVIVFAFDLASIISACITLFSYVVIDEKGITLKRGILKVNHISWEQVRRVEIFKAMHRRSVFFSDTYVRISTTEEES